MRKQKQLHLFKADLRFFGGRLLHGKRRSARPLSSREPIHIVMRSSWAKGPSSFLQSRNKKPIERLIKGIARKYFVRVYQKAVAGNHIHLVVKIPHRRNYKTFVRVLSSSIASHVMKEQSFRVFKRSILNQEGGDPLPDATAPTTELQGKEQQFWQFRPWSRVLHWGRDFKGCCGYLVQNTLEAMGFVEFKSRIDRYSRWLQPLSEIQPTESS